MNISLVPPEHAHSAWNDVRHYLEPAVETANGRWTMEHLCAAVCMGSTQLWVAFDEEKYGAFTTEITQYPAKRVLSMHFLAEDFDLVQPTFEQITDTPRHGCETLKVWQGLVLKYLQADGFEKSAAFYERV